MFDQIAYFRTNASTVNKLIILEKALKTDSLTFTYLNDIIVVTFETIDFEDRLSNLYCEFLYINQLTLLPYDSHYITFTDVPTDLQRTIYVNFHLGLLICYLIDIPLEIYCNSRVAFRTSFSTEYDYLPSTGSMKNKIHKSNFYMFIDKANTLESNYYYSSIQLSNFAGIVPIPQGLLYNSLYNRSLVTTASL